MRIRGLEVLVFRKILRTYLMDVPLGYGRLKLREVSLMLI